VGKAGKVRDLIHEPFFTGLQKHTYKKIIEKKLIERLCDEPNIYSPEEHLTDLIQAYGSKGLPFLLHRSIEDWPATLKYYKNTR